MSSIIWVKVVLISPARALCSSTFAGSDLWSAFTICSPVLARIFSTDSVSESVWPSAVRRILGVRPGGALFF